MTKKTPKKRTLTTVSPVLAQQKTYFTIVLDRSTSMGGLKQQTVDAFNDNLRSIREAAAKFGQETYLSVVTFADMARVDRTFTRIEEVRDLSYYDFSPYGNTALFDAVGLALEETKRHADAANPNASFVIMALTDGEENRSRGYREGAYTMYTGKSSLPSLAEEIQKAQATDRYTIAFLVPRGHGNGLANFGIPRANIREWEQTTQGVRDYALANNVATMKFMEERSYGATSSKSYYQTDLSDLKKNDLKKFDDLSANFKAMTVDKEQDIQSFIESHGKKFVLGAGYYMLTKKEKLRSGRNVLIQEKGSRKVFGGDQARQLLGIPSGEVTVTPGNHSNYDVYFQSTSRNRKLVRGTKLLYDTTKAVDDQETWDSAGAKAAADAKAAKAALNNQL